MDRSDAATGKCGAGEIGKDCRVINIRKHWTNASKINGQTHVTIADNNLGFHVLGNFHRPEGKKVCQNGKLRGGNFIENNP